MRGRGRGNSRSGRSTSAKGRATGKKVGRTRPVSAKVQRMNAAAFRGRGIRGSNYSPLQ
jgi:hypothetical protein